MKVDGWIGRNSAGNVEHVVSANATDQEAFKQVFQRLGLSAKVYGITKFGAITVEALAGQLVITAVIEMATDLNMSDIQ